MFFDALKLAEAQTVQQYRDNMQIKALRRADSKMSFHTESS
jgi:hypothetical protein